MSRNRKPAFLDARPKTAVGAESSRLAQLEMGKSAFESPGRRAGHQESATPRYARAVRRTLVPSGPCHAIPKEPRRLAPLWRAVIEIGSVDFLLYSNLLMGEFTHTNQAGKSMVFAMRDMVTPTNFAIAIVSALFGYVGFEYLRNKL